MRSKFLKIQFGGRRPPEFFLQFSRIFGAAKWRVDSWRRSRRPLSAANSSLRQCHRVTILTDKPTKVKASSKSSKQGEVLPDCALNTVRRAHRNRPHVQLWGRSAPGPSQRLHADTACNLKHPANNAGRAQAKNKVRGGEGTGARREELMIRTGAMMGQKENKKRHEIRSKS